MLGNINGAPILGGLVLVLFVFFVLGPTLYSIALRLFLLLLCVLVVAAIVNPDDASFALWVSQATTQSRSTLLASAPSTGVFSWVSSSLAAAFSEEDPWTWVRYNMIAFSLVYIPSIERHALGVFGVWIWCDSFYLLSWFARQYGPTIAAITRGGHVSGAPSASSETEASYKAKALSAKMAGQYATAADHFLAAASLSKIVLHTYHLDAARCLLSSKPTSAAISHRIDTLFRQSSEALASAGRFDDAGDCLVELARATPPPSSHHPDDDAIDMALCRQSALFVEAMHVYDAGDHARASAAAGLQSASVYANAAAACNSIMSDEAMAMRRQWMDTARAQYAALAASQTPNSPLAKQASLAAILCDVACSDLERARQAFCVYDDVTTQFAPSDHLLHGLFDAYERWDPAVLDDAIAAYATSGGAVLEPWQRQALRRWKATMEAGDLT
ncbi:Aste57867_8910 [Aphanomyces stellatus]|uniref:Aste57867_8910 protein n=1 Tax=Aphanomyces stellatus TaxID=120398 RepID=A0A485KLP0_9STRA|nr:hypothetical protein As57867_008875 [Aphanomyces stellatus]VFT85794.1 Aste57867_8910 [Aphanomyces stellatus]